MTESGIPGRGRSGTSSKRKPSGQLLMVVGNGSRAFWQLAFVLMLANLGSASDVAIFTVAVAVCTPAFNLAEMSMRNVYLTHYQNHSFGRHLRVRFASILVVIVGVTLIAVPLEGQFWPIVLVALARAADSAADIAFAPLQRAMEFRAICVNMSANSAASLLVGSALFYSTSSLEWALLGSLAVSILCAVLAVRSALVSVTKNSRDDAQNSPLLTLFTAGLPSGLAFSLVSLLTYLPIYFLNASGVDVELAKYAVMSYAISFISLVLGSFQQVLVVDLVNSRDVKRSDLMRRSELRALWPMAVASIGVATLLVLLGPALIPVLFGATIDPSLLDVVPFALTILLLPLITVNGAVLLTRNRYSSQFLINLVSAGAAGIGAWFWWPVETVSSAGLILLLGMLVRMVLGVLLRITIRKI